MKSIRETMQKEFPESQFSKLTVSQILDSYSHVELTEEETQLALIEAKRRKEAVQRHMELNRIADENRKRLTGYQWSYEQTKSYMLYRSSQIFKGKFELDQYNQTIYEMLLHYFSNSPGFVSLAESAGVKNASLKKGLLLTGVPGTGKTWLMRLFSKNQRQVFIIRGAKDISESYAKSGWEGIEEFMSPIKNPINDYQAFLQPISGLCIDDAGTEDIRQNFANKSNVIADVIQQRYDYGYTGPLLHLTSNLTAAQLEEWYGMRVVSRMRECFNFIHIKGVDRRK